MNKGKRATIHLDPTLHRALRVKAAETETGVSELVNAAVRQSLGEDAADLAIFDARVRESVLPLEDVLKDLKRRGKPYSPHQALRCKRSLKDSLPKFAATSPPQSTPGALHPDRWGSRSYPGRRSIGFARRLPCALCDRR